MQMMRSVQDDATKTHGRVYTVGAAHYTLYTSFPPGHDDVDGDYDDVDGDYDDDDDNGFPANSHHDKIPPWWE